MPASNPNRVCVDCGVDHRDVMCGTTVQHMQVPRTILSSKFDDTIRLQLQVQLCPFDHLEVSTVRCICVPRKIFGSYEHLLRCSGTHQ